jgi:hypothetical protein
MGTYKDEGSLLCNCYGKLVSVADQCLFKQSLPGVLVERPEAVVVVADQSKEHDVF